jgi:hypothetical protein
VSAISIAVTYQPVNLSLKKGWHTIHIRQVHSIDVVAQRGTSDVTITINNPQSRWDLVYE